MGDGLPVIDVDLRQGRDARKKKPLWMVHPKFLKIHLIFLKNMYIVCLEKHQHITIILEVCLYLIGYHLMNKYNENRKYNYLVIYDFFSKKLSDEYKLSFKKLYQKVLPMENGLKFQSAILQHVFKLGLETIVVFFVLII